MHDVLGSILAFGLLALIAGVIGAVLLRVAARWVSRVRVGFGSAYLVWLLSWLASAVLGAIVGLGVGVVAGGSVDRQALMLVQSLAMAPVSFLIQAWLVSWRFKVGFGAACLITLVALALAVGLSVALGVVGFVVMLLAT